MPTPSEDAFIPLCEPELAGREWEYVKECLDTGWVSSVGSFVGRFENEFAAKLGVRHAVAMASGTAALHIALLTAGIQPDDEVLMPALTFIAPANAVRYCNAWPVFVDVDPHTWQMDPALVAEFLERGCVMVNGELRNRTSGRRVKALLPVHLLGQPCAMGPLAELAGEHGLTMIEDATESLGAKVGKHAVGTLGLVGCFSFNGNKLMTTGAGGMLVTNEPAIAKLARYLSTQAKNDGVEYRHEAIGYNYRLTNVQAAIGCAQLETLDAKLAAKRRIAERYHTALNGVAGVTMPGKSPSTTSAHWLSTILLPEGWNVEDRIALRQRLVDDRIETRPLWLPIPSNPPYAEAQMLGGKETDRIWTRGLSLPSSCSLTPAQQDRVIHALLNEIKAVR